MLLSGHAVINVFVVMLTITFSSSAVFHSQKCQLCGLSRSFMEPSISKGRSSVGRLVYSSRTTARDCCRLVLHPVYIGRSKVAPDTSMLVVQYRTHEASQQ